MSLIDTIKNLPDKNGIYQYFDDKLNILYIGKAKSLKRRVKSYFTLKDNRVSPASNLSPRIFNMVSKISIIKTMVVDSEQDALVLENSLIKSLKPKYNILLRDDKTYPYILIDKNLDFPYLEIVRKINKKSGLLYFGPYPKGIRDIIDSIYEFVPLVQKKSCLRGKEPCLFYQIKRCFAPCANLINKEEYSLYLSQSITLLNNPNKIINLLQKKMLDLSSSLRFEEANNLKIRIERIKQITNDITIDLAELYNFDIFAIYSKDDRSVLMKIFMRDGKITLSDYQLISHNNNDVDLNYFYTQSLINHYKNNPPIIKLDAILLPFDLDNKANILGVIKSNIKIINPKYGDKKRLIDLAINNAKNILENNKEISLGASLKELLNLENIPLRIEVFDTSHHKGSNCVGGMIVYEDGNFIRDKYKRFNLSGSDEYSQIEEMLKRRIKYFKQESPPDLWLLDGGMGQINIALSLLESSGINIDVIAIAKEKINHRAYRAKGGARDILRSKKLELRLDKSDKRLLFFQKLRDEVHRYSITFHRKKKNLNFLKNKYTPQQIKKLLNYFGNFDNINNATSDLISYVLKRKS